MGKWAHSVEEAHDMLLIITFSTIMLLELRHFILQGIWFHSYFSGIRWLQVKRIYKKDKAFSFYNMAAISEHQLGGFMAMLVGCLGVGMLSALVDVAPYLGL